MAKPQLRAVAIQPILSRSATKMEQNGVAGAAFNRKAFFQIGMVMRWKDNPDRAEVKDMLRRIGYLRRSPTS